jgi:hypothetical protein
MPEVLFDPTLIEIGQHAAAACDSTKEMPEQPASAQILIAFHLPVLRC